MATVHDQFIGAADEVSYATGVAPANFFEPAGDSVTGSYERIESDAIRGPLLRADRFVPNPKGAGGQWTFEVLDKGFDFWLKHMLGSATKVTNTTTATLASLSGKSFSGQAARYASGTDTLVPFNYAGGKCTEWEISCEVDGIVKAALTLDFARETIGGTGVNALAVPTWPASTQLLTFIGGNITVGGSAVSVTSMTLTGNNGLKTDAYAMRGANSTTKREPKTDAMQTIAFELGTLFEDTTHTTRIASLVAAGATASLNLAFSSPQGGSLTIAAPVGRFDEGAVAIDRKQTEQPLKGVILQPTDGSQPITVTYVASP